MSRQPLHKWVFFHVPLMVFVVGTLFPFYWMLVTASDPTASSTDRGARSKTRRSGRPSRPSSTRIYLFKQNDVRDLALEHDVSSRSCPTLISLFCGLLAGYALARAPLSAGRRPRTSIFVTYLVPPTLLFIPLANIIRDFRLGDTPWSLILTYPTFLIPFCTWLLMGYFKTIPKELEE